MTKIMIFLLLCAAATNLPLPYAYMGFVGMGATVLLMIGLILKAMWELAHGR